MVFPIGAGSTNNDEMAANIATLRGSIATIQAQLAGFITPSNRIHFDHFTARSGEFDYGPLGVAVMLGAGVQSIPDDTATAINWSTANVFFGSPKPVTFSSNATSEIKITGLAKDHLYFGWGHVQFDDNSSGFREVGFAHHFGGSSATGDIMNVAQAVATAGKITALPYTMAWRGTESIATGDQLKHFTLDVRQNSGAALDLIYAVLYVTRFY